MIKGRLCFFTRADITVLVKISEPYGRGMVDGLNPNHTQAASAEPETPDDVAVHAFEHERNFAIGGGKAKNV
ncbi:hypothetical protein [Bradyrhizobium sp. USDA 3315]